MSGAAAAVLDALAAATGGHAGEAGPGDAVGGVPARFVAAPGSTDEAAAVLRAAAEADLDTMQLVRCAFDPAGLSNPGKIFPTPRLCGEVPGRHRGAHPLVDAGLAEQF